MAEYIDRELAKSAMMKQYKSYDEYDKGRAILYAIKTILEMPAAKVAPVVQCKDCKYFKPDDSFCYGECSCAGGMTSPNDDDFCSYGERRKDNG